VAISSRTQNQFRAVLAAVAVAQAVWLVWIMFEPLPNAKNVGGILKRWMFLGSAFPEVIPGTRVHESHLGAALIELRNVEFLPQRVPIVLAAALIAGAAVALGRLVLRGLQVDRGLGWLEHTAVSFGVGASGLASLTLIAGRLGGLAPWPVRAALGALIVAELVRTGNELRRRLALGGTTDPAERSVDTGWRVVPRIGFVLIAAPFFLTMLLGSMLPAIDFDVIEYHLEGPKEYYQAGRIAFLPYNVYTSMPFGVEMLHLLGMEVLDDWWTGAMVGQLLVALHAPAATVLIVRAARLWGSPRAAWVAGIVYLTTPWVYRIATIPYVEGPLCYYHAALIWALAMTTPARAPSAKAAQPVDLGELGRKPGDAGLGHPSSGMAVLTGLLAGGAMSCKYPALVSAVLPFGAWTMIASARQRSASTVLRFALGWAAIMSPWLIKNVVDTGNPVYPLAYRVFGARHWSPALDAKWSSAHGTRPIRASLLVDSVLDVAGRSDWQSPLYAVLAPLAFLNPFWRRRAALLWGYCAYLFLTWWLLTHRLDRFWLPILVPLAILAGLGADWTRSRIWTAWLAVVMTLLIITNFAYNSTALAGLNEWTHDLRALRTSVPARVNGGLANLDATLPPDAKVLLVGQAAVFHLNHAIVYNTVFNEETIETLARDRPPHEVAAALRKMGVTDVYVDWFEIERYRSDGNYGFTDFVTHELFDRLVRAGVLGPPEPMGLNQELYHVPESRPR
jgi:hypothetical protein